MASIEWKERFLIHSQLRDCQRKVSISRNAVVDALATMHNPYVAFSTGKDSTVVLHLVRQFRPDVPAVYFDADCAFPESLAFLNSLEREGVTVIRFKCTPFLDILREHGIDNPRIEKITLKETVYKPVKALVKQYGFDGCFIGLRKDESAGRAFLRKYRGLTFFSKQYNYWECQPIADWSFADVWAYLLRMGVDYNEYYDKIRHFEEREQRISYWAGESARQIGRWQRLNQTHPDLFNRLAAEFPAVRRFV